MNCYVAFVKRKVYAVIGVLLLSLTNLFAQPFTIDPQLFDQRGADDALGLFYPKDMETVTIYKPTAETDRFSNGAVMVAFKGKLYCQWQSSAQDEDSPDTWVAYSSSTDVYNWSEPMPLANASDTAYCTSGGWWVNGDTLIAFVNVWPLNLHPRGGYTCYTQSVDGTNWTTLQPVIQVDGTPLCGVMEQDPKSLADGRIVSAVHLQPGLLVNPIYTDHHNGYTGWKIAKYSNYAIHNAVSQEIEPSWFQQKDGTLVMVFRDQGSSFKKIAATSVDKGQTWSYPVLTDMPDSRSKQSAGNLPDGTAYMVSNPVGTKSRFPLVITLAETGKHFDRAFVLRGGKGLQEKRYEGKAKTIGYSYPKSFVWEGYLYVSYAVNKEDIQFSRVPLYSLKL